MLSEALAEIALVRVFVALVIFHEAVPFDGKELGNCAFGS